MSGLEDIQARFGITQAELEAAEQEPGQNFMERLEGLGVITRAELEKLEPRPRCPNMAKLRRALMCYRVGCRQVIERKVPVSDPADFAAAEAQLSVIGFMLGAMASIEELPPQMTTVDAGIQQSLDNLRNRCGITAKELVSFGAQADAFGRLETSPEHMDGLFMALAKLVETKFMGHGL